MGRKSDIQKEARQDAEVFDAISRHVTRGGDAIELLNKVFHELGPYRDGKVTDETWYKVRDFFGFDDSE